MGLDAHAGVLHRRLKSPMLRVSVYILTDCRRVGHTHKVYMQCEVYITYMQCEVFYTILSGSIQATRPKPCNPPLLPS